MMGRRRKLTDAARKSRRRHIACGHFRTHDTRVYSAMGAEICTYCKDCRVLVRARPMTREERAKKPGE